MSIKLHFDQVWRPKAQKEIKTVIMETLLLPVWAFFRSGRLSWLSVEVTDGSFLGI